MTNFVKWNGTSEDGQDSDKKWSEADVTWGDYQLLVEIEEVIKGGRSLKSKQEALEQLGLQWVTDRTILVISGGSQGARQINQAIVETLPILFNELNLAVIHQTGQRDFESTLNAVKEAGFEHHPDFLLDTFSDSTTGGDLRFFDQENRELVYEIDEWNASGESSVWVKTIEWGPESRIFARWGNDDNTTQPPSSDIWSEFEGVWHLGDILDSTVTTFVYRIFSRC